MKDISNYKNIKDLDYLASPGPEATCFASP